ncbi:MAG TPA: TonB-dependent receptor [Noviherbaspirillum sp.]|nr:TonB-dependent receptor [Noviherbaspirillum sp.]
MKNKKISLPAAVALLVLASEANSQPSVALDDRPVGSGNEATLPAVTVTGERSRVELQGTRTRVTNSATGLPSAVSPITSEEIGTINVSRDISNVFRRVPGVVANNLDQGDTGNGFRMRGFATGGTHGADTAVYVDGVPQNMPSSEAGAGHGPAFLEWLTPDMIQRIDVIKGPVSALFGDQNRAGAVSIRTVDDLVPSSVGLTLESHGGRRASLVWSKQLGSVASTLIADSYRTDSYRQGAWQERDNLFWKLSTIRDDARYSIRLNHYRSDFEAAGYLRYDRLAAGQVARSAPEENALLPFGGGRRTGLVVNRAPAAGEAGLYATAYLEDFERIRGGAAGGNVHNVGSDDRIIAGASVSNNFVFSDRAALQAGADIRRDKGEGIRQRYENRLPTSTYLTNLNMDLYTYGVFAQGQVKPADHLKLTGGLRVDRFDYDIENRKLPTTSTGYRKTVTTPKIGAAWTVLPRLDVFANIAQGFRSPAAQQISPAGAQGRLGAPGGNVNTGIAPSKVRSYDAGFTATPAEGWSLSGVAFYTLNEDEIVMTAPNVFRSVGDTTRKGFELESRLHLWKNASAYASYTRLLQAEINNSDPNSAYLLSVPRHQFKLGAEYRHALGAGYLRYNADAYVTSGIPYFSGTPLQQRTVPTYTRYDLRATYSIRDIEWSAFAVFQPQLISESFFATAAGLWVSTQPRHHFGISARYFF